MLIPPLPTLLLLLLLTLSHQQPVWGSSTDFQCGSTSATLYMGEGPTEEYYEITYTEQFSSVPSVALSTIGLQVDPSTSYLNYYGNCADCGGESALTTGFQLRLYLNITSDDGRMDIRVSYLAVNQQVFPNVFIDYAEYTFANLSSGTGKRRDSSNIHASSTPTLNPELSNSYICFISGFEEEVVQPFDLYVTASPIEGTNQEFNVTAVTNGNGKFVYTILYRVVFENNLTVWALNGTLYGYQSSQLNPLQPIDNTPNFFNGLIGFNFNSVNGIQFDLSADRTNILTNYTFQNLTYQYFYVMVQESCRGPDCNCQIYYYMNTDNGVCEEVCGDGRLFSLECDDGNIENGDGCSSACRVESNYGCVYGGSLNPSKCYPIYALSFESANQSLESSLVTMIHLMLSPIIASNSFELSQFTISPESITINSMNYNSQTGELLLNVSSPQPIAQNTNVTVGFNGNSNPVFSGSTSMMFSMPSQSINPNPIPPSPEPQTVSDQHAYQLQQSLTVAAQVLMYSYLFSFVLGLFGCKLIAVEMCSVIQISFYALATIANPNPTFLALYSMKYVSGFYINLNLSSQQLPSTYRSLGLSSNFLNNFNIMLVSFLLCPILSLIFFLLSKHSKSLKTNKKMKSYFWESLCDLLFSICIFNTLNITTSLILNFRFVGDFLTSIVLGFFMSMIIASEITIFNIFKKKYKEFKEEFQPGLKGYIYPSLLNSQNVLVGVMAGVGSIFTEGIFVMMAGVLGFAVYLGVARPYINNQQWIRQLVNLSMTLVILAIYAGYGQSSKELPSADGTIYLPIVVIVLLYLVLMMNLGFILKHIIQEVILPWIQQLKEERLLKKQQDKAQTKNKKELDPIQEIEMQLLTTMMSNEAQHRKRNSNMMKRKLMQREKKQKQQVVDQIVEITENGDDDLVEKQPIVEKSLMEEDAQVKGVEQDQPLKDQQILEMIQNQDLLKQVQSKSVNQSPQQQDVVEEIIENVQEQNNQQEFNEEKYQEEKKQEGKEMQEKLQQLYNKFQ